MKYTWEKDDVRGGIVVEVQGSNEKFMICYTPNLDPAADSSSYFLVSLLDGNLIMRSDSKMSLLNKLNVDGYSPISKNIRLNDMVKA